MFTTGYPMVKKSDNVFSRFYTILAYNRQTNGQTFCDSIICIASCGNKIIHKTTK